MKNACHAHSNVNKDKNCYGSRKKNYYNMKQNANCKICWHIDLDISHLIGLITLIMYVHQPQLSHLHSQISPALAR